MESPNEGGKRRKGVFIMMSLLCFLFLAGAAIMSASAYYWIQESRPSLAEGYALVGGGVAAFAFISCCVIGCIFGTSSSYRVAPALLCILVMIGVFLVTCTRVGLTSTPEPWAVFVFLISCLLITCCCSASVVILIFGGLQVGTAFDLEIQLETARNVNPSSHFQFFSISNILSFMSIIIEFFQLSRLSFLNDLSPVGYNQAREVTNWATLDTDLFSREWGTIFWIFVGAPGGLVLLFIVAAIIARGTAPTVERGKKRAANVVLTLKTLVSVISIIVFQGLLRGLACTTQYDGGPWTLNVAPSIQCWTSGHVPYLVASLLATLFYHIIFTGILLLHKDSDELSDDWEGIVLVHNTYAIASLQIKLGLVALQAYFTGYVSSFTHMMSSELCPRLYVYMGPAQRSSGV
eukprot:TRINITY_DN4390_c0_g1_i4.p1 TRINITY_DN4390_c0_g1~~TRINITY_DN4390_c0_g1_i4.p1  ORF type:complete len:406 (+),score=34.66 TRINITY_DN4390_c0_g1_i4:77-1294(+)